MENVPIEELADYLRSILDYCPESGVCKWRKRPRTDFQLSQKANTWNRKHEGREAGQINPSNDKLTVSLNGKTFLLDKLIWIMLYTQLPKTVYHKNGFNADNSQNNLTENKETCKPVSRYPGGKIYLIPAYSTQEYYKLVTTNDHQITHVFSHHVLYQTGYTRLMELADILNTQWECLV